MILQKKRKKKIIEMPKSKKGQEKYQVKYLQNYFHMFSSDCADGLLPIQNKMPTVFLGFKYCFFLFQAPDALGLVPIGSVDVKVRHILPFYDLKVSQCSSLSSITFLSFTSPVRCFLPNQCLQCANQQKCCLNMAV